jgi:hypothetical protein
MKLTAAGGNSTTKIKLLPLPMPRGVVGRAFPLWPAEGSSLNGKGIVRNGGSSCLALPLQPVRSGQLAGTSNRRSGRSFCVDEKNAIQALDRLSPGLPWSPGRAERHGFGALALCRPGYQEGPGYRSGQRPPHQCRVRRFWKIASPAKLQNEPSKSSAII